mmetsp:Transcript_12135/g.21746  ORF Transcript_12135/g.21746 Transcript_12135/m.21746 type:complete len:522 (-) Transcript_12135:324-1889(-)
MTQIEVNLVDPKIHDLVKKHDVRSKYIMDMVADAICEHDDDHFKAPAIVLLHECFEQLLEIRLLSPALHNSKPHILLAHWLYRVSCAISLDKCPVPSIYKYLPPLLVQVWYLDDHHDASLSFQELSSSKRPTLPPYSSVVIKLMAISWERAPDSTSCFNLLQSATEIIDETQYKDVFEQGSSSPPSSSIIDPRKFPCARWRHCPELRVRFHAWYVHLLVSASSDSGADPEYIWCNIQEALKLCGAEAWARHPRIASNVARLLTENKYTNCMLEPATISLLGKGALMLCGTWEALWALRRRVDGRVLANAAATELGWPKIRVWEHITLLAIRELRRRRWDPKDTTRVSERVEEILGLALGQCDVAAAPGPSSNGGHRESASPSNPCACISHTEDREALATHIRRLLKDVASTSETAVVNATAATNAAAKMMDSAMCSSPSACSKGEADDSTMDSKLSALSEGVDNKISSGAMTEAGKKKKNKKKCIEQSFDWEALKKRTALLINERDRILASLEAMTRRLKI